MSGQGSDSQTKKTSRRSPTPRDQYRQLGRKPKLEGPAPQRDKLLWLELAQRQIADRHIPPFLRNEVVAKTGRDTMGRIELRRMTGLNASPATAIVRRFEELLGDHSREELVEKLEALPSEKLTKEELIFLELVRTGSRRKSLARLMAEAGVKPSNVLRHYAEGALALGKVQAAIEVSRHQPKLVKDLLRNALDKEEVCSVCVGTGTVKQKTTSKEETMECPACKGARFKIRSSKHKTYAMDRVLEIGKLKEKAGPAVNVTQQVGVQVGRTDGFMERMLKTSDEVLYNRRPDVIEGEARVLEEGDRVDSE